MCALTRSKGAARPAPPAVSNLPASRGPLCRRRHSYVNRRSAPTRTHARPCTQQMRWSSTAWEYRHCPRARRSGAAPDRSPRPAAPETEPRQHARCGHGHRYCASSSKLAGRPPDSMSGERNATRAMSAPKRWRTTPSRTTRVHSRSLVPRVGLGLAWPAGEGRRRNFEIRVTSARHSRLLWYLPIALGRA